MTRINRRTLLKQGGAATVLFAGLGSGAVTPAAAAEICEDVELDVVLVLDESGSMGWQVGKMQAAKDGAKAFIDNLDSGTDKIGLVSFTSSPQTQIDLTSNFSSVKTAIDGLSPGGGTDIGAAVDAGHDEITDNGRSTATPIIVLLSNGQSNYTDAVTQAQQAKNDGVRVITIAYGSGADTSLLADVASGPDSENAFVAAQDDITDIFNTIAQEVCNALPNVTCSVSFPGDEACLEDDITFSASATDPDGSDAALTYAWDLGPDGTTDGNGTSITTSYSSPGTKTAVVTVTDDQGDSSTCEVTVDVVVCNQPPTAVIDVETDEPVLGEPVELSGENSTDPDGNDTIVSYEWDLDNDGTFEESGETATTTFDPTESCDTTRTVGLRVTDDHGATDTTTATVTLSVAAMIDIVPTVNPDGEGEIPVKVKPNDCFDPADLDVSTVRFGDPEDVDAGNGAPPAHDGHLNKQFLMLHFPTPDADFEGDESVGKLVGQLTDGTGVVGTDTIKFANGGGPP